MKIKKLLNTNINLWWLVIFFAFLLGILLFSNYIFDLERNNRPPDSALKNLIPIQTILPSPTPKPLTWNEIAKLTLRNNPNYKCPSATVIFDWVQQGNYGLTDSANVETIKQTVNQMYFDNPLFLSCPLIYMDQYAAEAGTIGKSYQKSSKQIIIPPRLPRMYSTTCNFIGNTLNCFGF